MVQLRAVVYFRVNNAHYNIVTRGLKSTHETKHMSFIHSTIISFHLAFKRKVKIFTGQLIDTVIEQLSEQMKVDLNGCVNVTLIQDGLSNIHNEHVKV